MVKRNSLQTNPFKSIKLLYHWYLCPPSSSTLLCNNNDNKFSFSLRRPVFVFSWWVPLSLLYFSTQVGLGLLFRCQRSRVWVICRRVVWRQLLPIWIRRRFANWLGWIELFVALLGLILFGNRNCLQIIKLWLAKCLVISKKTWVKERFMPGYVVLIPLMVAQRWLLHWDN